MQAPLSEASSLLKVIDGRTSVPFEVNVEVYSYEPDEMTIIVPDQIIVGVPTPYKIQFYYKKKILQGKA